MQITFLGASHGVPEANRRCSCTLIETNGRYYFIDMGVNAHRCPCAHAASRWRTSRASSSRICTATIQTGSSHSSTLSAGILKPPTPKSACRTWRALRPSVHGLKANHCEMRDLRFKKVTDGTIFDDGYLKVTAIPTQHCPDSHAFFVEAEGKAVLFTGDLKHPNVDFPKIAKEKPTEFIICEAAHFPATDYAPVLAACPTKQVLVNHYAPWNIPNVMQLAETLAPLPVKFVNDGMQITL